MGFLYFRIGTNWLKDSLGMLMKGKAEVAGMVGSMLELHPSLEEYKKKGTSAWEEMTFTLLLLYHYM